jgi:hypothetical protein
MLRVLSDGPGSSVTQKDASPQASFSNRPCVSKGDAGVAGGGEERRLRGRPVTAVSKYCPHVGSAERSRPMSRSCLRRMSCHLCDQRSGVEACL